MIDNVLLSGVSTRVVGRGEDPAAELTDVLLLHAPVNTQMLNVGPNGCEALVAELALGLVFVHVLPSVVILLVGTDVFATKHALALSWGLLNFVKFGIVRDPDLHVAELTNPQSLTSHLKRK